MEKSPLEARLVDLEVRYAWQEDLVEQLSDLVRDQQEQIDALRRELERLRDQMEGDPQEIGPADEPPPHY